MIPVPPNADAQPALLSPGGMIVREREPLNLEMPFGSLDGFITPVDRLFVRSHFAVPQIDVKTWRLSIEGEVLGKPGSWPARRTREAAPNPRSAIRTAVATS